MTSAQAAAYVQSQSACALIEAMAMQAANETHWRRSGPSGNPPYLETHFRALLDKYGIHHNAVHEYCFIIQP